ncbi:MAG: hypothetical protein Q9184_002019 [Pyrenodesmia sp. 2 TL-2023]
MFTAARSIDVSRQLNRQFIILKTTSKEWYGLSRSFLHPSPASLSLLSSTFFPSLNIDPTLAPSIIPPPSGETISQLHDRVAYALSYIICTVDTETGHDKDVAILICTHAATLIAIGRCLTGNMPQDVCEEDFLAPCAGMTKFVRRVGQESDDKEWRGGNGVGGGWDCLLNGNCDHLTGGVERTWRFSGEETFGTAGSLYEEPEALEKRELSRGGGAHSDTKPKI